MLLAANTGTGQNMGFPDVCNTPQPLPPPPKTVPIPYPNIAMNAQASPFSALVRVSGMSALNMMSKIPMTSGDDPGVAHRSFKQVGGYQMGNPLVSIEKMPAINLACLTNGNSMNNMVGAVAVPSVTTVFYTMQPAAGQPSPEPTGDRYMRVLGRDELARFGEAMAEPAVAFRMLRDDVAYLRIARFTATVPMAVFRAVRRRGAGRIAALVLDLRSSPGGDTEAMVRLADDFLPRDAVVLRRTEADGDEVLVRARQDRPYEMPVAVLVNGETASAAELFAGCLQCHGRGRIVGERTFGKGQMQRVLPALVGQGLVYAGVAHCRLPNGDELEGLGIVPDVPVAQDSTAGDAQLEVAIATALAVG